MKVAQTIQNACSVGGNWTLKKNMTIDHQKRTLLEAEKKRWRDVLERLITITVSFASKVCPLGAPLSVYEPDNGNFLKEVELLAKFDPLMENHLAKIKDENTWTHYLGQQRQNELIQIISYKMVQTSIVYCILSLQSNWVFVFFLFFLSWIY